MKKIKYLTIIFTVIAIFLNTTSCKDDFAETNTDPANIISGIHHSSAQGILA